MGKRDRYPLRFQANRIFPFDKRRKNIKKRRNRMKTGRPKSQKGANFERKVAGELSLWISKGKRPDIFWRTAGSGARATVKRKIGVNITNSSGDISCLDASGEYNWFVEYFHIELKRGYTKDIDALDFVDKPKGRPILGRWYDKAKIKSKEKRPLIIFQRNRKESCVFIDKNTFNSIFKSSTILRKVIFIQSGTQKFVVMNIRMLFGMDPDKIKNKIEKKE